MRLLIVSSVGTSLITNVMPKERSRPEFFRVSNHRASDLAPAERQQMDADISAARDALANADDQRAKKLSAELNGILSLLDETPSIAAGAIQHLLIATDTHAGSATGQIVADWLMARGQGVDLRVPAMLRTEDLTEFRTALADLTRDLLPLVADYTARGYATVFNLTGGFKGIPGFLQTVASIVGAESVYVFEGATTMLRIPRLPIRLDAEAVIGANFALFRRLAAGERIAESDAREAALPETMLLIIGGEIAFSEWGWIVWESAWANVSSRELLAPRTSRIAFTPAFKSQVAKLPKERIGDVNTAIEMLQRRLEGKADGRLAAFEFKKVNGKTEAPATHELYAWSGHGAGRIFLSERDGIWIAHHISGHLK